jgi:hypothetical protein
MQCTCFRSSGSCSKSESTPYLTVAPLKGVKPDLQDWVRANLEGLIRESQMVAIALGFLPDGPTEELQRGSLSSRRQLIGSSSCYFC